MSNCEKKNLHNVKVGSNVAIFDFVNLYGCEIGDNSRVGAFVEIQKGAKIGKNVKISSHTFICEGVTIQDDVFIGHNVSFINDKYPTATLNGALRTEQDWQCVKTVVERGASIGTSATILCGVTIGKDAIVGAGSVVTKDIPPGMMVAGVPARVLGPNPKGNGCGNGTGSHIPFVDLKRQYKAIKDEILESVNKVLESCSFCLGEEVDKFEEEFASYCGTQYCVALNSGTSALHLALLTAGVQPGDEVITVANTFMATCEAISYAGAVPVFVDIDERTYNIDVTKIKRAITPKTKAIIPVHLYGQPADLDPILEIADTHGLVTIEDAAQAHGAVYKERRVGGFGRVGCFSFYPGKNLGAYGEGGALVTNDESVYRAARMLRDHGQRQRYHHDAVGYNYRMDGIQGAVLRVKLRYLDRWIEARRRLAHMYSDLLAGTGVVLPYESPHSSGVYHLYVIRTAERDLLRGQLSESGIQTGLHYPVPCHLQKAYADLGYKEGDLPVTEVCARELLSLPLFAELTEEEVRKVAEKVKALYVNPPLAQGQLPV